jgi:hypothetical protein
MREIIKNIQLSIDGKTFDFRLTKLDAFSGVSLLRLLIRLEDTVQKPSVLDLITSLSENELRSVMTSCLKHTEVMLPAGPQPVMTGSEWGWPELEHDTLSCLKLTVESISWSLSGFFGGGGQKPLPEIPASSQ